jgi:hypothetical protein
MKILRVGVTQHQGVLSYPKLYTGPASVIAAAVVYNLILVQSAIQEKTWDGNN